MTLTIGFIMAFPINNVAAIPEGEYTLYPSANNAQYHWLIPHHGWQSAPFLKIVNDGDSMAPDVNYATSWIAQTNDFNNPVYYGAGMIHNATKWLSNATILGVNIVVSFDPAYVDNSPILQLAFSTNNAVSWNSSATYSSLPVAGIGDVFWNVTTQLPSNGGALLSVLYSTSFWVQCTITLAAYEYAPVDYLGFIVEYTQWDSWSYPGTLPPEESPSSIGANLSEVQAITGFGGLIGMAITPPVGLWVIKNSDEKGETLLKTLLFGAACFGMFMFGIG
jgi:hypothetical protein